MIVTGHQPGFLPGISVITKIQRADAFIVMDEMQYVRHSFVNRNRFSDGGWMTIPVRDEDTFQPINRVRISDPTRRTREKVARTLAYRGFVYAAEVVRRPWELLVGLNVALLRHMLDAEPGSPEWVFQSHLAAGRYDDVSEGLAAMVAEIGGSVWLSGPSGRRYLNERPFLERGIDVEYHSHEGPNPCALELLREPLAA